MGAFGLLDDHHHARVPLDLIVEANPRLDAFWLNRIGALVRGTTTELQWGHGGGCLLAHGVDIELEGVRIPLIWDEPMEDVERPWFACPVCGRRCRHVYLRGVIACRRCCRLDYAVRHLHRQVPALARVARLRRRLGDCGLRPFAPLPARRRGRSRARHDQLVAMILDEEAKLIGHLQTVTRDLERRIDLRRARGEW
jgi:hypothetical protein